MQYTKTTMMKRFLYGSKRFFLTGILASAVVAGLDMIAPQIIRIVVDYCLEGRTDTLPAWILRLLEHSGGQAYWLAHMGIAALAILITALVSAGFQYLNTYLNSVATEGMTRQARNLLFSHIEKLPYRWHMENQTGDIIQRCTSDVNTVRDFVSEQLIQVVRIVILIVFSMVCMAVMNLRLAIVVFVTVPLIVLSSWYFFEKVGHLYLECDENEGELSTITQENLTGVRVVRAFGRENYERERFRAQNVKYTDTWMDLCKFLSFYWGASDLIMGVQLMLIIVLGILFCADGTLTAGELIAFISYNSRLIYPVRRLGRMISEMSKAGVAMDRLLYILNSQTEDLDPDAGERPAMTGDIRFEHVSFRYEDGVPMLEDIDLTIPGGTTVGILGSTGSGKTSLVCLLNRLYDPTDGQITVNGVPIQDISLPWLRSHVGMVLQEPYLFSRTIGENIQISGEEDPERLRAVTEIAALTDTIERFHKGYDTVVGERGVTLSGGQKQRTAIARMLMQDTPIMVFDDSLSAVDAETDEKIRRGLQQYMGERTVILISHRISTLMEADQILVLEDGRIVQRGTHEELIQEEGEYRNIWKIQHPEEV